MTFAELQEIVLTIMTGAWLFGATCFTFGLVIYLVFFLLEAINNRYPWIRARCGRKTRIATLVFVLLGLSYWVGTIWNQ